MKWGVRKDRKRSGRTKRQNDFENYVAKGQTFAKENAPGLLAAGLSVTAIAAGQAHLVPIISTSGQIATLASKVHT